MRRMSDYVYWFVSGRPPITRKRNNPNVRNAQRRVAQGSQSVSPDVRNALRHVSQGSQGVRTVQGASKPYKQVVQARQGLPRRRPASSQLKTINRRKQKTTNGYE